MATNKLGFLQGTAGNVAEVFAWPTFPIDREKMMAAHQAAVRADVGYRLGSKPKAYQTADEIKSSDCSGYVGWLIYRATEGKVNLCHQGTFDLADRFHRAGLKLSTVEAGTYDDGAVRVAVMLRNVARGILIGHTCIIFDGQTLESYGGHGVGSRVWTGKGWQGKAQIWVLSPPNK